MTVPAARRTLPFMDSRDILRASPFFADVLDERELEILAAQAHRLTYDQGATPIREDGPAHGMFVVISGEAAVNAMGHEKPVATLGPGDVFGEMSLLTGARRSATVTAASPLEVLEISRQAMAAVLDESPTLVERLAAVVEKRQAELDRMAGGDVISFLRFGNGELAGMIRSFFGRG